jgi:hypothetical protein
MKVSRAHQGELFRQFRAAPTEISPANLLQVNQNIGPSVDFGSAMLHDVSARS